MCASLHVFRKGHTEAGTRVHFQFLVNALMLSTSSWEKGVPS